MEIGNEIGVRVCVGTFDDRLGLWPKHDIANAVKNKSSINLKNGGLIN